MNRALAVLVAMGCFAQAARAQIPVIPSIPVEQTEIPVFVSASHGAEHPEPLANFRLRMDFLLPDAASQLSLRLHPRFSLDLQAERTGEWQTFDLQYEQLPGKCASFSASRNGRSFAENQRIPGSEDAVGDLAKARLDGDFTAVVRFTTRSDGALFSKCRTEKWEPGAKMLGVRSGKLFYDIGWLGVAMGKTANLADGNPHTAAVRSKDGRVTLFVDGKEDGSRDKHTKPDLPGHTFHIAQGAAGFVGDLRDGTVDSLRFWESALPVEEAKRLSSGKVEVASPALATWTPQPGIVTFPKGGIAGVPTKIALTSAGGAQVRKAWVQPLAAEDHAKIISRWSEESIAEGGKIFNTLCMTCHGTLTQEGSLPTSRHFQRDPFKNGNDPFRMFQTLSQGYGLMMPMPQYTAEQKYALIHYIRETFVAPHNKTELFPVTDAYLSELPVAMRTLPKPAVQADDSKQYEKMNFGPMLEWTFQVAPENIAYKGIAVRLDPGEGGVSKGRAWIVYDHDTMRVATAITGSFVDWKGVAFDGSHNSHLTLTGDRLFTNPVGPGWANPLSGSWEDPRLRGRDGKPYGPLPREWALYQGAYLHGSHVVQSYRIGDADVLESAEVFELGKTPVFLRTLNIGKSSHDLKVRLAPETERLTVRVGGADSLKPQVESGFHILSIPAGTTPARFRIALTKGLDDASLSALIQNAQLPLNLSTLIHGGPARWKEWVKTQGIPGKDDGPFATDILTHPESGLNPWQSWMRLTGFDFFADGKRAAVCTWMGDVWLVDGVANNPVGELKWQRIATGLFQPLGLKIVNGTIFVTCRDQIAKLLDLNGDGEIDFIECFNNDQQVTEHFHEFAMGLQTDAQGNFYYAKSARHALPALVPQHGTLLRVSADGTRTDILASGFRAANGVCVNPDGTFFVTDQEGHWTPKNRINLVRGGGPSEFFGNMMGYHDVTDERDSAMEQPVCWITNAMDRSPAELVWVPKDAKWGPLNGSLLDLSYGFGKIYTVPFEKVNGVHQGGICALPMPQFPTGVMRGRFHPRDGQFYGCGMYAWAGNQTQPGGFYRVRFTGKPALQPIGLHFETGRIGVEFSDPLDASSNEASRYTVKAWSLKRTANYGSPHVDEHSLEVTSAELVNSRTVRLSVPKLHPTMGLQVLCKLKQADGSETERDVHGTVHVLVDGQR